MKIIVSDSGPIIHLNEVNALEMIVNMGEIFIPLAVAKEVERHKVSLPDEFTIIELGPEELEESKKYMTYGNIHIGESEAIILARQLKADLFLTDDASARLFAETKVLNARGSLGVVLWNLVHKKILSIHPANFQ